MAHWYVFLGDWLWWGYGINPAITPKIEYSAISIWVVSGLIYFSSKAIKELFSSLASKYSILPQAMLILLLSSLQYIETNSWIKPFRRHFLNFLQNSLGIDVKPIGVPFTYIIKFLLI